MIRDEFKAEVDTNHKIAVYVMLKNSLTNDTTFKEFDEMAAYAEERIDLYQEHDGEVLDNNPDHWTKDYMNVQLSHLVNNFSRERVALLKRICRKIYGCPVNQNGSVKAKKTSKKDVNISKVGAGLAVAGGVAAVIGAVTSHTAVAVAGGAVAIVGGLMIAYDKIIVDK